MLFEDPFSDEDSSDDIPATLEEESAEESASVNSSRLYNIISLLFVGLTGVMCLAVVGLFINPNMPYNFFPPDSGSSALPPTEFIIPTLEPSLTPTEGLPASWTPTLTSTSPGDTAETPLEGTPAPEGLPTAEPPLEGATPTPVGGTPGPVPTPPPGQPTVSAFPFALQEGVPQFTQNAEENGGCAALYLVGKIIGLDGQPVDGIAVWVTGENFETPDITKFNTLYGAGSYQVLLNSEPIEAEFEVQLWTVQAQPLSDKHVVRTRATCEENLIFVNFVQNHEY
jgi:hypothetical protein